jgi:hypothetical protein
MRKSLVVLVLVLFAGAGPAGCGESGGGGADKPTSAASASPAQALPTKADLAAEYSRIVGSYNSTARSTAPVTTSKTSSIEQLNDAADRMASANWSTLEPLMAMRRSVEMPAAGYPTDAAFYRDLHSALGTLIDVTTAQQNHWVAMREAQTREQWEAAWDKYNDTDDGSAARRIRALLGLPDIPIYN